MLYAILILGFIVSTFLLSVVYIKYKKLKNEVKKIISDLNKPLRYGYYVKSLKVTQPGAPDKPFDNYVYIKELDRYTNGESKIEINKIESSISEESMSHDRIKKFIQDEFKSLKLTSDIEWLESEADIKEQRRSKLEHLKEVMK